MTSSPSRPGPSGASAPSRLLLFAHGSPTATWRAPFDALLADLQARAGADRVALAFLAHDRPSLDEAAAQAAADGVGGLRILPLFMSGGGHVLRDLPDRCAAVRRAWPALNVEVLPAVGQHPRVVEAMADIALERDPRPPGSEHDAPDAPAPRRERAPG